MKRISLAVVLLGLLITLPAFATPYNTITVDGLWGAGEWDQANELVGGNTFPGWDEYGNVRDILVTWDASNLYIAVRGNAWNNAMVLYIDSSSITTGQENADFFQGYDTQSFFDADFVGGHWNMNWGGVTDIRSISVVDGATTSLLGLADIQVADQNSDGGLGQGLTEIKIPWSLIGTEVNGTLMFTAGTGWANNTNPAIPAGGLGGFSGDELGGLDQEGGTDGDVATMDTPLVVSYDLDGDGLPDQLTDEIPPTLVKAVAVEGTRDQILASFDEPVTQVSAELISNWSVTGATVLSATLDANQTDVMLSVSTDLAFGFQFDVMASNIADLNDNIVATTITHFCLAELTFELHMKYKIEAAGALADVGIEGGMLPLTWDPTCDDLLYDDGTHGDAAADDSLYTTQLIFCLDWDYGETAPVIDLNYKFTFGCTEWESIDNHHFELTCGVGQATADIWWNDENPENFTTAPVDVIFAVDMSDYLPLTGTVGANGGTAGGAAIPPLNWNIPSETILSDADYPGGVADDGIFGTILRFPAGSYRHVNGKYVYLDEYECSDQGNRTLFLNEAAFDTLGGTLGPLTLPVSRFDRCTVTPKAVEVVFQADLSVWYDPPTVDDVIAVNGGPNNQEPQVFNWDVPSLNPLLDDGVTPDVTAGDRIYTGSVVFPDSSDYFVEYKFLFNEVYECTTQTNRYLWLNYNLYDAVGNPQILGPETFNLCETVGVDDGIVVAPTRLDANWPNPFNPETTLRFRLAEEGQVRLMVFDLSGRLVKTLVDAKAPAGEHTVIWNGRDESGQPVATGVYFARMITDERVETRKMTLLK
ncbi:MAG: T9SS type A sorting domain-containing protein [bacterium]|nr:T9SS type A sorting domain-containing protein [bacterium]